MFSHKHAATVLLRLVTTFAWRGVWMSPTAPRRPRAVPRRPSLDTHGEATRALLHAPTLRGMLYYPPHPTHPPAYPSLPPPREVCSSRSAPAHRKLPDIYQSLADSLDGVCLVRRGEF
ncbi:hypothetical protein E2C01_042510 [Portunus trituberculatus]|uniref:Secreted protein n=1 Tax=Portunus trituberculatus TaxID=210409 RepID=A0A5B7FV03_PORTR|nr:hypothetical protein [Portunus trituberculatus]